MRLSKSPIYRSGGQLKGAVTIYLVGAFCLELRIPDTGFNIRNLLMVLCSLLVILMASSVRRSGGLGCVRFAPHDLVYGVYLAFCLVSTIWSPSPIDTVVQVLYLIVMWIAAITLAEAGTALVIGQISRIVAIIAAASLLLAVISPGLAFQPFSSSGVPELRGVFAHQIRFGLLMALTFGLLFIAYLNREGRRINGFLFGAGGTRLALISVCLVAAGARSYTAFMVISILVTWSITGGRWTKWIVLSVTSYMVFVIVMNIDAFGELFGESGVDMTLTGRTTIWERTLAVAGEAPIIGHGYASFFSSAYDYMWPHFRPGNANNSFISAYFETGMIGVVLICILCLVHLRGAFIATKRYKRYPYSFFATVLTILCSLTGVTYAGKPSVLFAILLLLLSVEARALEASASTAHSQ